jgi:chromosome segregation ATPase
VDEVKIPKGLRELYADCLADDSRAMRTTTSKFMAELIERIVRAEAQVAEADFNFGGWRAIKKRLEAQVAALTEQLQTANKELALWRSEHDPCPFALENERLTEQVRVLKQNAEDLRDSVLNQRGSLAENGMTNDQVNDVLAEIDDAFFAQSAAPGKESQPGVSTGDAGTNGGKA